MRQPMKVLLLLYILVLPTFGAQQKPAAPAAENNNGSELEPVLSQMDQAAAAFKSAQADFKWDNYQKAVDETETQTGKVYFHRSSANVEAFFDITAPHA